MHSLGIPSCTSEVMLRLGPYCRWLTRKVLSIFFCFAEYAVFELLESQPFSGWCSLSEDVLALWTVLGNDKSSWRPQVWQWLSAITGKGLVSLIDKCKIICSVSYLELRDTQHQTHWKWDMAMMKPQNTKGILGTALIGKCTSYILILFIDKNCSYLVCL